MLESHLNGFPDVSHGVNLQTLGNLQLFAAAFGNHTGSETQPCCFAQALIEVIDTADFSR